MAKDGGMPAWAWIGCGCLLCIVLLIGGCIGLGALGVGFFKSAVEDMADPVARRAKVVEALGAEDLPAGYHARSVFGMPFVMQIAVIDDGPAPEEAVGETFEEKVQNFETLVLRAEDFADHTFVFVSVRGRGSERIEDIVSGRRTAGGTSINLNLDFDADEDLGQGTLEIHGTDVQWRAARGTLRTISGSIDAAWAAVQFQCSGGAKDGIWIEHLRAEETADEVGTAESGMAAEPSGAESETTSSDDLPSPARPEELAAFLGHFAPCD